MLRQSALFWMALMLGSAINPVHSDQTVSGETSQPSQIQDSLIKRVIDDESCNNNELKKSDTVNQNECK